MAELTRYLVEDAEANELTGEYDDLEAARAQARQLRGNLVAVTYTYDDSELVESYLPGRDRDGRPIEDEEPEGDEA